MLGILFVPAGFGVIQNLPPLRLQSSIATRAAAIGVGFLAFVSYC